MSYFTALLGVVIPLLGYIFLRPLLYPSKSRLNFPPGPPTIPFLGNLHQIPLTKPFLQFAEWSRSYGSHGLVGLHLGPSNRAVVLNSWRSVRDLLDQRGVTYSSRPYVPIVEYVVPPPGDIHLVFMPYGPKWRKARRTITDFLRDEEVDKLVSLQDAESSQMMFELLSKPGKYHDHILRYFGAIIMSSVFGTRGKDFSDTGKIKQFFACQAEWAGMLDQGAVPPYDVFPFLRYVPDVATPWRGWKQRAAALKKKQNGLYHDLFEDARERLQQGKGEDSFVAGLLRNNEREGYSDVELEYIAGFLMEGGSDTTAGAFETFVLAMAAHPEIQKKAQAEVDAVFGKNGVQSEQIKAENLPYLKACFLETLRWRPGFPLAIPHATTQDDVYQGYNIPANTTILMNIWAISHDPDEYEDPDSFQPERFLENPWGIRRNDEKLQDAAADQSRRTTYGFGAGRRVCAGQRMAENSMLMTMSKILWYFNIVSGERAPNTSVQTGFRDAILTGPNAFDVNFEVRGKDREEVLIREWTKADAWLQRFE
ncbi:Fumitremorgin C synthase 4 [Colletotrichum truncatum]|uniref:Fumitremorgin C synthase 4 n=1 Tax=Colletotrichum truncatum TaxID=5467 RepID=A0ACC3Z106_COLTU|nr:Fumitremorgin C synthase 4 [Colletotrichum truncatum]KAF6800459.1 Fumitremorgin C synthase 4 [Colletotrichum truncatum]